MSKNKIKFITFLSDGLSINEAKTSILIIAFIVTIVFALVMYYVDRTIGGNLTSIIGWLIASISSVNIANAVFSKVKDNVNLDLNIDSELDDIFNDNDK